MLENLMDIKLCTVTKCFLLVGHFATKQTSQRPCTTLVHLHVVGFPRTYNNKEMACLLNNSQCLFLTTCTSLWWSLPYQLVQKSLIYSLKNHHWSQLCTWKSWHLEEGGTRMKTTNSMDNWFSYPDHLRASKSGTQQKTSFCCTWNRLHVHCTNFIPDDNSLHFPPEWPVWVATMIAIQLD